MVRSHALLPAALGVALLGAPGAAHAAVAGETVLVDRPSGDAPLPSDAGGYSVMQSSRAMSADGNRLVFESDADGLLGPSPTRAQRRPRYGFVRDRAAAKTELVCRATGVAGAIATTGCNDLSISPNGRYVVFRSTAANLDPDDTDATTSVFRRDLQTATTILVSRATGAAGAANTAYAQDPTVADDGSVVFSTNAKLDPVADAANNHEDVYVRSGSTTRLLSRAGSGGAVGVGASKDPVISGDGTTVAFVSRASNLNPNDTNARQDVYTVAVGGGVPQVESRRTANGAAGNDDSFDVAISHTGRYVAYVTSATDIFSAPITTDTNGFDDVILRDRALNVNAVATVAADANHTQANGNAYAPTISGDGTQVTFSSSATTLVAGVSGNRAMTFVRRPSTDVTSVIRRGGEGSEPLAGSVGGQSGDGAILAFGTELLDLARETQVYARTAGGGLELASGPSGPPASDGASSAWTASGGSVSDDGRIVAFVSGATGLVPGVAGWHAYVRDGRTGTTTLLDTAPGADLSVGGAEAATVSGDGTTAVFTSSAADLHPDATDGELHLYRVRLATGALEVLDRNESGAVVGGIGEGEATLSTDGRLVAFTTRAPLVAADAGGNHDDVYVRDADAGTVTLVSRAAGADGAASSGSSFMPTIAADGRSVAFSSDAPNLAGGDGNMKVDVFVRDLQAATTTLVSRADGAAGAVGNGHSFATGISGDGGVVAFTTGATNLADGDTSNVDDVHVRDVAAGTTVWVSRPPGGGQNTQDSTGGSLGRDGRRIAFTTYSTAFALPDPSGENGGIVVRDLVTGAATLAGVSTAGDASDGDLQNAALSGDGHCVVFVGDATNLVAGGYASPDNEHVFLRALDANCPGEKAPVAADPAPAPAPPPAPGPGGPTVPTGPGTVPGTTPDRTAPRLTEVSLTRKTFTTKGRKAGTTLRFTLSEAASVEVTAAKIGIGRRKGSQCVSPTALSVRARAKAKGCERLGRPATLATIPATAGTRSLALTGKVGSRRLRPGRYRLQVAPTDASRNAGKAATFVVRVR